MVNPGKLDHLVTIMQPVKGTDTRGDKPITYTAWKRVWCSIEPLAGREMQFAQQMHGNVTHKVGMRHLAGVNKSMQLLWNGRTFQMGPVLDIDTAQFEMQFYATERR